MRQFLPPPRKGAEYNLSQTRTTDWIAEDHAVLERIPGVMVQEEALTEGRLPSPFSRALQFYGSLRGDGGPIVLEKARLAFRGLSALVALREMAGLDLRASLSPSLEDPSVSGSIFAAMLRQHLAALPEGFAPGSQFAYLTLHSGKESAVVAGVSPLTSLFPAARRLPANLAQPIFWYSPDGGWTDPTAEPTESRDFHGPDRTRTQRAQRLVKIWLTGVLEAAGDGRTLARGMAAADRQLILAEWQSWLQELSAVRVAGQVVVQAIPRPGLAGDVVPFFLDLLPQDTGIPPETTLPQRKIQAPGGKESQVYFVTKRMLEDRDVQINGDLRGSADLAAGWEKAPARGENLGLALGRENWLAPLPYVLLDKLFTPMLSTLVDQVASGEVKREWLVLRDKQAYGGQQPQGSRLWLFPFDPQILSFFTAEELKAGTELLTGEVTCTVRFKIPDQDSHERWEVTKHFHRQMNEVTELDPGFDFRVFPNFDLSTVPEILAQLPRAGDRRQFARLRLSPKSALLAWKPLQRQDFAEDPYLPTAAFRVYDDRGNFDPPAGRKQLAPGKARFWEFQDYERPFGGMFVPEFGFFLLRLPPSTHTGALTPWNVGVDFGTSNSCVAFRHGARPETLPLPSLTTTLLPVTPQIKLGDSHEGASSQLDFPYAAPQGRPLAAGEYFPTQVITKLSPHDPKDPDDGVTPLRAQEFDLRNGLVFFKNLSQVALEEPMVGSVIHDFPAGLATADASDIMPRFYLRDQIKWQEVHAGTQANRRWRYVFHRHLRLQVLFSAIAEHARVASLTFSYPRAFNSQERKFYMDDVRTIWGAPPDGTAISFTTESDAAARYIQVEHGVDETVLDIGGGTTDIAIFSDQALNGETSFRLAADVLDRYVLDSAAFREAFCSVLLDKGGEQHRSATSKKLQASFARGTELHEEALRCVWFGFLGSLMAGQGGLRTVADELRRRPDSRPVDGFFITASVLFGGLAYFGGLMDRERHRLDDAGAGRGQNTRSLSLIGNGARYVGLLEGSAAESWTAMLKQLFATGAGLSPMRVQCEGLQSSPKAAIALGLLLPGRSAPTAARAVYSAMDSGGFALPSGAAPKDLVSFYQKFLDDMEDVSWTYKADSPFAAFLTALDSAMPRGQIAGEAMIPGLLGQTAWATGLVAQANQHGLLAANVRKRMKENADRYREDLHKSVEGVSLEPLFITELAGLLTYVSTTYGAA